MEYGLLLLRIVVGLVLAAHGSQKLFGWFGGGGLEGTGGFFAQLGFPPGRLSAALSGLCEFGGGLLLAAGLLTPIGAGLIIANMIVAAFTVHAGKGLFVTNGGYELPLTYGVVAASLAITGPGRLSLDHAFGLQRYAGLGGFVVAIVIGLVGSAAAFAMRPMARRRQAA